MNMTELYHAEALLPERVRKRRVLIVMLAVAAAGLAACIILCTFATRRNLRLIMPLTIGTSILSGWIVITLFHGYLISWVSKSSSFETWHKGREMTIL